MEKKILNFFFLSLLKKNYEFFFLFSRVLLDPVEEKKLRKIFKTFLKGGKGFGGWWKDRGKLLYIWQERERDVEREN